MRPDHSSRRSRRMLLLGALVALTTLAVSAPARAGRLSFLDEVVQDVVRQADNSARAAARGGDGASLGVGAGARSATRLFGGEADEPLDLLVRRHEEFSRFGRQADATTDAVLKSRFARLVGAEPELARTFDALAPAEKRLVVEMSETAQRLARRYPGQAEGMIRALGTDGLSAVRVYGDDVAEVIVKEGPSSVDVLRKTGRAGWSFFTQQVLPNKGKLAAAGVLAAFLANPDQFIDTAGQITEYAAREFARAGVQLAGAITAGATRGLEESVGQALSAYGLDFALLRYLGMGLAGLVVVLSGLVILGLPVRWMLRPITWPARTLLGLVRGRAARTA